MDPRDAPAIFICSGRPDSHRDQTERWLADHGVPYGYLMMRAAGDRRPDVVVKKEMLDAIRGQGYEPLFAVDDRPSVVAMWRENGVPCLAVDDSEWQHPQNHYYTGDTEGRTLLTLMVGPSGAGKSSWLQGCPWKRGGVSAHGMGIRFSHILSSDQIREDLCGDWRDQSRNAEVFEALHDVARTRLRRGLPTVIDATHLRRKDRLAAVDLAPPGTRVRYVVLDRPLDEKLRDARTPEAVVRRHDQTFRSQLQDILAGDGLPQGEVVDLREKG